MPGRGFLLIEACVSLLIMSTFSLLIFSWHSQLITRQATIFHTLQALFHARSALEQALQGIPLKQSEYPLAISYKRLLPNYSQITVTVVHNEKQLISLTSGLCQLPRLKRRSLIAHVDQPEPET